MIDEFNDKAHKVIGSIPGISEPASWAEPGHNSQIDVCVEHYEGERMAYIGAYRENDTTVRIDLDRDGWTQLRDLAAEVVRRMNVIDSEAVS